MAIKWYLVPEFTYSDGSKHKAEIGSYEVSGNLTDFSRGTYLAYADKGLVTLIPGRRFPKKRNPDDPRRLPRYPRCFRVASFVRCVG